MKEMSKRAAKVGLTLLTCSVVLSGSTCHSEVICNCPARSDAISITTRDASVKTLTLSGPACVGPDGTSAIVSKGAGYGQHGFVPDSPGYEISAITTGDCTVTIELGSGQVLVKRSMFTYTEGCCQGVYGGSSWDLDAALCQLDPCPKTCPQGQEMFNPDNACCGTCQTPSQACLDARAQWLSELATRWAAAKTCARDSDCFVTSVGSRCTHSCTDAIAFNQIDALTAWAGARGDELCAICPTRGTSAGCPIPQDGVVCRNETCVLNGH